MTVPPSKNSPPAKRRRRGIQRPRQGDVRLTISLPALVVLLIVAMGVANYLINSYYVENAEKAAQRMEKIVGEFHSAAPRPALNSSAQAASSAIRRNTDAILKSSLLLLVIFSVVALAGSIGLVWTVLRPIRHLADAAATITRGEMRPNLEFTGGAFEIDQLGKTFNSMVDFINSMIEQRESYLSETAETGCMILTTRGRVTTLNTAGEAILGVDRETFVGKSLPEIRRENPELLPSFLDWCEKSLHDPMNIASEETELPGDSAALPLVAAASLLRDERNVPSVILINFRDASTKQDLRDLFSGTDQLAALGTFTYGLSHELRNPLGALKGATQLLGETVADREDCRPYVNRIVHEVNRLDHLIRELYNFSHTPVRQPEICDPNEIARKSLMWARQELTENLQHGKTVREEYAEGLPRVIVQPDRIIRAVTNVILNAFEHSPEGATIVIRTAAAPSETQEREKEHPPLAPVLLEIMNTGSTIPEENRQRIFEPFFSTKQGGSGLGLAIAYQIASQNRGRLQAQVEADTVRMRFVFRAVRPA